MRRCDGIICFGGADWWYHNRGHYDIQMCRQFARDVPVLYVNSIGVRRPSVAEGSMFVRRVARKVKSWRRAFVRIEPNFAVISPVSVPGRLAQRLCQPLIRAQVRAAARRMRITRPLIWVECPTAATVLGGLPRGGLLYQRTDRYEEFPGVDAAHIRRCDRQLKDSADVTLFCSRFLHEREAGSCRAARYVDHGVDFERFCAAGSRTGDEPADVRAISRPRVGFVGGIDSHTFDAPLFDDVARRLPHVHFILVGQCSLGGGWRPGANVHLLGRKPYEAVASYMAACDVLIMPWNRNEWIRACNPVKLKEYLAVGRPVVSTEFEELSSYAGCVRIANGAAEFAGAIADAVRSPGAAEPRRARVQCETWSAKAAMVVNALADVAVQVDPGDSSSRSEPADAWFETRAGAEPASVQ